MTPDPVCALNHCTNPQGAGTWATVSVPLGKVGSYIYPDTPPEKVVHITLPVCEIHWEALRYLPMKMEA
jgi:hypothetical protein